MEVLWLHSGLCVVYMYVLNDSTLTGKLKVHYQEGTYYMMWAFLIVVAHENSEQLAVVFELTTHYSLGK